MSVWFYFLALLVLTVSVSESGAHSEGLKKTVSSTVGETTNAGVEDLLMAVQKKVEALRLKVEQQDEEIKDLTHHLDYLKMAGPKLRVLELIDDDDSLGEMSTKKHVERFTHVTAVSLRVPKKERSKVPKKKLPYYQVKARRNAVHIVATANTKQQIKLWDTEQNQLAMVDIESSAKVTALLTASANTKAFLLAGLSDGSVQVYAISAWRTYDEETNTLAVEGYMKVFSNGVLLWSNPQAEVNNEGEEVDQGEAEEKEPAVLTLGLNNRKHAKQFMVGYDNGIIRLYKRDGRMRKEVQTGNSTITEIGWETDRSSIPIFTDSGFRFMKLSGFKMIGGYCPHKEGTQFTGYSFDVVHSNLLYVAYSDGSLLLFDSKKLAHKWLCAPKFEIKVEEGSSLHLEATEGYLLASSPTILYIFNTSDVSTSNYPHLVEKRAITKDTTTSSTGRMALTRDTYHHTLIVTTQLYSSESCDADSNIDVEGGIEGSTMVVYESYMKPKEKEKKEKGWAAMLTRTPILVIGLVFVIFMKFGGKGGNPLSSIFPGGGGRGRKWRRGRKSGGYQNRNMMDMQRGQMLGMPPRHSHMD